MHSKKAEMNLLDYIQGRRKGKKAHRLERQSMTDPFLSDALEGFDTLETGEALTRIRSLQARVTAGSRSRKKPYSVWTAAAVLAAAFAMGGYLFSQSGEKTEVYYSFELNKPWENGGIYLPDFQPESVFATPPPPPSGTINNTAIKEDTVNSGFNRSAPLPVGMSPDMIVQVPHPDSRPEPVVGGTAYNQYLNANIQFPIDESCGRLKGKLTIAFRVNNDGRPFDINVQEGLCDLIDQEAIRLVKQGPDWIPGDREVRLTVKF